MIPTLTGAGNECLLMERVSVWSNNVQVGDVVVATSMTQPCGTIVKRVVALQGQQVRLRTHHGGGEEGPTRVVEVPRGHVWLQGDNYYNSRDSRDFGAMPYAMLRGRVFAVVCFWCVCVVDMCGGYVWWVYVGGCGGDCVRVCLCLQPYLSFVMVFVISFVMLFHVLFPHVCYTSSTSCVLHITHIGLATHKCTIHWEKCTMEGH